VGRGIEIPSAAAPQTPRYTVCTYKLQETLTLEYRRTPREVLTGITSHYLCDVVTRPVLVSETRTDCPDVIHGTL